MINPIKLYKFIKDARWMLKHGDDLYEHSRELHVQLSTLHDLSDREEIEEKLDVLHAAIDYNERKMVDAVVELFS